MRALVLLVVFCLTAPAHADNLYKCTDGGRVTYGDRPCSGKSAAFAVRPPPPPDPALEARLASARNYVASLASKRAAQDTHDAQLAQQAARRQHDAASEKRTYCSNLRLRHMDAAERDQRTIGNARLDQKPWRESQAKANLRERARLVAEQCPA
ncbi:DUF4124 domain-containing protein [Massilia aurea]|uniref:DUF4124 domain-containing protein n=1 Tax=Massilia aurea TaxID=373040 RepID=UPI003461EBDB